MNVTYPLLFVDVLFRVSKVIGYNPPELLGKSVFDFFHPEDRAHMRESFEQGKTSFQVLVHP